MIELIKNIFSLLWVILLNAGAVYCIITCKVAEKIYKGTEYYDEAIAVILSTGTVLAVIAGLILHH